ncbi:MAG TPA: hypothetical protein VLJ86_17585 [Ramlibacter sp.]|nr:hypothetical protein [Ramlibacter sp.]
MTGLLHRLAARANGTAWTVRSDVRLPFASASLEQAQDAEPPLMDTAKSERRSPVSARADSMSPAVPATSQAAPATQARAASAPERPQSTRPAQAAPATPKPLMPVNQQAALPLVPSVAKVSAQPEELAPAVLATPVAASSPSPAKPSPAPFQAEEPSPLLPPRPHAAGHAAPLAPAASDAMPFAFRPARQATASRETEVHIHIGRIDVTALHEAPRPKARPRERTQPVSLDAYLAGRSKPS